MWTRVQLKEKAKQALNNNYWKVVLASLLLGLISGGAAGATTSLNFNNSTVLENNISDFQSLPYEDEFYYEDEYSDGIEGYSEQYGQDTTSSIYWDGYYDGFFGNSMAGESKDYVDGYQDGVLDAKAENEFGDGVVGDDFGTEIPDDEMDGFDVAMIAGIVGVLVAVLLIVLVIGLAVGFAYNALINNPIAVGLSRFFFKCLNLNEKAEIKEVAYAFDNNYKNVMKILFIRDIKVFLWGLLFIIPGIVKEYEYRMMPYLLAENPNLTKDEAFRLSKQMMTGNKWKAFVLDLSFILWNLLSGITLGIVGIFYVEPYKNLTNAALYEELSAINGYPARAAQQMAEGGYAQYNPYGYEANVQTNPYGYGQAYAPNTEANYVETPENTYESGEAYVENPENTDSPTTEE